MSFRTTAASRRLLGLATCVGVSQPMLKARGAKRMRESQGLGMRSSASDVVTGAAWTKRALQRGRRGVKDRSSAAFACEIQAGRNRLSHLESDQLGVEGTPHRSAYRGGADEGRGCTRHSVRQDVARRAAEGAKERWKQRDGLFVFHRNGKCVR